MSVRPLLVGTAGHVDHGKTTLVRALTGVDTDRLPEERARGLTIDLGFAPLPLGPELEAGVVDVPGHRDFVRNMIAGAVGVDVLLLVVAADEGPMPQTREHLELARLLGVEAGVVALTRADLAEPSLREIAIEATRDELERVLGHDRWPILEVSASTGEGVEPLRAALRRAAMLRSPGEPDDLFRLAVDRSFSVRGAGTIVTGTIWSGTVRRGERLELVPSGRSARVREIQVHGETRPTAGPRGRAALALAGVEVAEAGRGTFAVGGSGWETTTRLGARLGVTPMADSPLLHGRRVRFHHGTGQQVARVLLENAGSIPPGESGWAVLRIEGPVLARSGDPFVLRELSPERTVAGGRVAELDPPGRWKPRTELWTDLLSADPSNRVRAAVRGVGGRGVRPDRLPHMTGLPPALCSAIASVPGSGVIRLGENLFDSALAPAARAEALAWIEAGHQTDRRSPTLSLEALREALGRRYARPLVEAAVAELASEGRIRLEGPGVRAAGHTPRLTPEEARSLRALEATLEAQGLDPDGPDGLAGRLGIERAVLNDLLRLLVDRGELVAISPEIYITTAWEERLRTAAADVVGERDAPVAPAAFRERLHVTRRALIPLLEYLDRVDVTRRTPRGRVAGEG